MPGPHDDLFRIFPNLPRITPRPRGAQIARLRQMMFATRLRAYQNIERQVETVRRLRLAALEGRDRLPPKPFILRRRSDV